MDEKTEAFAQYDAIKATIDAEQAEITALANAGVDVTALQAAHTAHHQALLAGWTAYLGARGWATDAEDAARSGGENKPREDEPGGEG